MLKRWEEKRFNFYGWKRSIITHWISCVCEWVLGIKCAHGDEQSSWELSECFLCGRKFHQKKPRNENYKPQPAEWRLRENWHIQRPFSWKAWRFFSLFLVKLGSKLQTRNPLKEFLGKILSSFVTILSIGFCIVVIGRNMDVYHKSSFLRMRVV